VFRRFLIVVLIFLIAVVVAADRVGEIVAAHVLAGKLQTDEHLPNRPSTSIDGFPFLTQAFGGNYKDVKVTAHEVPVNAVPVTTLTANLHGVHLPFSKVIHGSVSQVPVDRVDGTAFVSFADANSYLSKHRIAGSVIRLKPGSNGTATVMDRVHLAGKLLKLRGVGSVSVASNVVTVGVSQLTGASSALLSKAAKQLAVSFPLSGLPFRLQITAVTVTSAGLSGAASVSHIVLGS
jgi:hypothetical protein